MPDAGGQLRNVHNVDHFVPGRLGVWTHVHRASERMNPRERRFRDRSLLSVRCKDRERSKRTAFQQVSYFLDDALHYPSAVIPIDRAVPAMMRAAWASS